MYNFLKLNKSKFFITALAIALFFLLPGTVKAAGLPEAQNGVITLTEDVTLSDDVTATIEVPSDKTITLDLNGKKITAESGKVAITNKGKLTIKGEGEVIANGNYAVLNHGELLTIAGGKYSKTTPAATQSLISNGWYTNTDNTSGAMSNMVINGGEFDGGSYTAIKNDSYGILTINNGTFTSTNTTGGIQETGNGITFNGGTFDAVILVQNYTAVEGENKEAHFVGGTFNKAVNCKAENKTDPKASSIKTYIGANPIFNNSLSISNSSAATGTNPFVIEQFDAKTIGGSLTFGARSSDYKLPAVNLDGMTIGGGLTYSNVENSTISNTVVNGSTGIKAGNVTLKNVTTKQFSNNAKDATVIVGEGTERTKLPTTSN